MCLCGAEGLVHRGGVHRPIREDGGGAHRGEGPKRGRSQRRRVSFVGESLFQWKDVPTKPGEEVQAGAEASVRELGQVRMQVHHSRQDDQRSYVDDRDGRRTRRRPFGCQ